MDVKIKNREVKFVFVKHVDDFANSNNGRMYDLIMEILNDKRISYEINYKNYDIVEIRANLSLEVANEIANVIEATDVTFQVR